MQTMYRTRMHAMHAPALRRAMLGHADYASHSHACRGAPSRPRTALLLMPRRSRRAFSCALAGGWRPTQQHQGESMRAAFCCVVPPSSCATPWLVPRSCCRNTQPARGVHRLRQLAAPCATLGQLGECTGHTMQQSHASQRMSYASLRTF